MYKYHRAKPTTIKVNDSYEGETLEQKINRIVNNKEPITDGAPIIYTPRKDGVRPEHDIRTDRWEIAVEAMEKVHQAHQTKRAERQKSIGEQAKAGMEAENKENKPGGQSIGGTEGTTKGA